MVSGDEIKKKHDNNRSKVDQNDKTTEKKKKIEYSMWTGKPKGINKKKVDEISPEKGEVKYSMWTGKPIGYKTPKPVKPLDKKICSSCGTENPIEDKFCQKCGTKLTEIKPASSSKHKETQKKGTGINIVIALGVCCIGIIALLFVVGTYLPDTSTATCPECGSTNVELKQTLYVKEGETFATTTGEKTENEVIKLYQCKECNSMFTV